MKFGFEIESIINTDRLNLSVGEYHNGIKINSIWETQRDASLRNSGIFDFENGVEFVSKVFNNKKEALKGLYNFKKIICKKSKSNNMGEILYFNKSCGAHIHFSIDSYNFWKSANNTIFIKTTEFFFKELEKNKNISEETKQNIKNQYFRDYAKRKNLNEIRQINDRASEWNFKSELNNKGFEWRSFNLKGCKNWEEFFSLYKIAFKTLNFLEKQIKKWGYQDKIIIEDKIIKMKHKKHNYTLKVEKKDKFYNFDFDEDDKNKEVFIECAI